jgi:restriction endonuclease S subunit
MNYGSLNKYEDLLTLLRKDGLIIADVASVRNERFQKTPGVDFQYLEIGGLRGDGTVASETVTCDDSPSRASQRVRCGDIITSTVRPIRRLSALVAADQDGYVCSSGFVVLQPKQIAAEVLLVYLRLPAVCELMDLHTSASLYPAISEKDLLNLPIPKIPNDVQRKISTLVRQSFNLKAQSEGLLVAAKRALEIAIEQDEAAGMAYLAREGALV